jgi:hypothetical protein
MLERLRISQRNPCGDHSTPPHGESNQTDPLPPAWGIPAGGDVNVQPIRWTEYDSAEGASLIRELHLLTLMA